MADAPARLYDSRKWRKARLVFLNVNPLCVYCERIGRISIATVVDHIKPHKGDEELFWDQDNWQPLCKDCHDSAKAIEESRGYAQGCGVDGVPVDKNHPWNE